ncbi:MAG TPA: diguanylate cyclase [Actinomycetota bacterium]|nr:diguanylate cyclase [Actinomycetota bacterium]
MSGSGRAARGAPLATMIVAVLLIPASLGFGYAQHVRAQAALEQHLRAVAEGQAVFLSDEFERARGLALLMAHNPALRDFYTAPGSREEKIEEQTPAAQRVNEALAFLARLDPLSIGEAGFVDASGAENARVVRGLYATPSELARDVRTVPYFQPVISRSTGVVYQTEPYLSPNTTEWVVSYATKMPTPDSRQNAIVHFAVSVESLRRSMAALTGDTRVRIVDASTGRVVIDSERAQPIGGSLGTGATSDLRDVVNSTESAGLTTIDGVQAAFRDVPSLPTSPNRWVAVVAPIEPPTLLGTVGWGPVGMLAAAAVLLVVGAVSFRNAQRDLTTAATTDGLTGLGNRRKLMSDLEAVARSARSDRPTLVAMFDLDGFKAYNDTYGHPAGDALLVRLGRKFDAMIKGRGCAYRLGGDEFCLVTAEAGGVGPALVEAAALSLSDRGEGFHVTASKGWCMVPSEARTPAEALRLADTRMYADKMRSRPSPEQQSRDVLLGALYERYPELHDHLEAVGALAEQVAQELGMTAEDVAWTRRAGELHDVGKVAIPDAILRKPGPLDAEEWTFMQRHTVVGERILEVAPSLSQVARLVRSHHEWVNGEGYPDGLTGDQIPRGARVVSVCDAYHAMTSGRPYKAAISHEAALAELRRNAGTQFDPDVVEAFCAVVVEGAVPVGDGLTTVHGHL